MHPIDRLAADSLQAGQVTIRWQRSREVIRTATGTEQTPFRIQPPGAGFIYIGPYAVTGEDNSLGYSRICCPR